MQAERGIVIRDYRLGSGHRVFVLVLLLPMMLAAMATLYVEPLPPASGAPTVFAMMSLPWFVLACSSFAARVTLYAGDLEIVNPWGTNLIPLGSIAAISGSRVLLIRTTDGKLRWSVAVQGANILATLGRETHVTRVARELSESIRTLSPAESSGRGARWRPSRPPWIFFLGEALMAAAAVPWYFIH